jgi:hypothetical protein
VRIFAAIAPGPQRISSMRLAAAGGFALARCAERPFLACSGGARASGWADALA